MIPQSFNSQQRRGHRGEPTQGLSSPTLTLGGPIMRDRIWFFGSYRRVQEIRRSTTRRCRCENRGNLWFVKVTTQLQHNQRLQVSVQYDRVVAGERRHSRRRSAPGTRRSARRPRGLSSATMQIANPVGVWHADQGRTAGELQLQLGDELERGCSSSSAASCSTSRTTTCRAAATGSMPTKIIQSNPPATSSAA